MIVDMKTAQSTQPTVVLIPAYEPGPALQNTAVALTEAGYIVVVIDDGSGSRYQEVFDRLDGVHLLQHAKNQGKGAALKTGYRYIQRRYPDAVVVTADADGQHAIKDIAELAKLAQTTEKDTVTRAEQAPKLWLGSRVFDGEDVPLRSRFGNVMTRNVFALATRQWVNDTQTGLRAFHAQLIDFMLSVPGSRFEYETNVLLASTGAGVQIIEQPIKTIYENNNDSSHFNPLKDSLAIYTEIIKFTASSLSAFLIDYGMFLLLITLTSGWSLVVSVTFSNILARLTSAGVNFTVNKQLIFKRQGSVVKQLAQYSALAGGILVGNTLLLTKLVDWLGAAPYIAKLISEITFFIISYYVQKKFIFKKQGVKI